MSLATERLLAPRHGPDACRRCLNLVVDGGLCRACRNTEQRLAAVVPISYGVGGEWLHRLIMSYKRDADPSVPDAIATLATVLDQFVVRHERCLALAVGARDGFHLITTVPSADPLRDLHHPLRWIVGSACLATRDRYERLLVRSDSLVIPRVYDPARYAPTRHLDGEAVLLIDDMWTSGASAESAAGALLAGGAGTVAAVVLARYVNRGWRRNDVLLRGLATRSFAIERCVLCDVERSPGGVDESRQSLASATPWQT